MCFFEKIKSKLKLKKDIREYSRFFHSLEKDLNSFRIIESSIPTNITNAYEQIKNIKKYSKLIKQYEEYSDVVSKHNDEITEITKSIQALNKIDIINNCLTVDFSLVTNIYDLSLKAKKYSGHSEEIKSYIQTAELIYNNFDTLQRQKRYYNDKIAIEAEIYNQDKYIDYGIAEPFIKKYSSIDETLRCEKKLFYDFTGFLDIREIIQKKNKRFIIDNINDEIFENINNKSLDNEQRESVLTDELSTLVVAGAGSGKTLTICGKVEYLLKRQGIRPEDILLLSYSKKSADDLQTKINSISKALTVGTFHKIGLDILKERRNKTFVVEDQYKAIIEEYFREAIKKRPHMLRTVLTYYGMYISPNNNHKKYKDEGELYEDLKKQDFQTLKDQLLSLTNDLIKRETLKKERVKSFEEMAIANWYYINGINYVYERPYEVDVSTDEKRQYLPDFYLPDYQIYHEHYGINKSGKANQFSGFEETEYRSSMEWKRNVHREYDTTCLETFSYEFEDETIFDKLEIELKKRKVEFHPLSDDQISDTLNSIYDGKAFKSLINLIRSFLSLYKAKYKDEQGFDELLNIKFLNAYERRRTELFLTIVRDVYRYYKDHLIKDDKIDFDDMILQSMEELKQSENFKYKYIIVDEFQDISISRMKFLKELINHGQSKLFAVGDDWQSIYRFSGCDLNIFLGFENYFGPCAITKITSTHRNSQELQDIAGPFIKANPEQFNKSINSDKHLKWPVRLMYYSDKKYVAFMNVLKEISKFKEDAHVLVLGRNNKDFEDISLDERIFIDYKKSDESNMVVRVKAFPKMKITYSTVHGSKGLEEDYVIIINADDTRLGFPNKMEDDSLLDLVTSEKSRFEFAEERRLWYVALTRTRNYTYIIVDNSNPSVFVEEIEDKCLVMNPDMEISHEDEILCPYCKSGRLVLRENEDNGNKFYGCSNYPYCKYSIDDFVAVKRNKRCRRCGDFMVYRKGRWGSFYGCHGYPRCEYTEKYEKDS